MDTTRTFYVTTPIYYVTAKPHLGSLYSTVIADVLARFNVMQSKEVFFLTGTDEHGQKVAQAAENAGMAPQAFVDQFIPAYKDTWKLFEIEYSRFIRTTDDYHKENVQKLIVRLLDQGDIYKSEYHGWYCTPCETFVTQKEIDGANSTCPSCCRPVQKVSEQTYFFKLSKYEKLLLDFYKDNPHFISPKERFNELLQFVKGGLKDISVSRTTVTWGVPFPTDPMHVLYVWIEALCNYITGVGYDPSDLENVEFNKWWPADVHVIGKDIVRFHGVYWPALLMAAELPLPKQLLVHGWITVDQQKMSKSLGNVVDPVVLAEEYGVDEVRYFLLRQLAVNQDGNFSIADLEKRISTELANDLGNLLQRTTLLARKYDVHTVHFDLNTDLQETSENMHDLLSQKLSLFIDHMQDNQFHMALATLWEYISATNAYFHAQEPWKQAKSDMNRFMETMWVTCHSLHAIACVLWPIMPLKSKMILSCFSREADAGKPLSDVMLLEWEKIFTLKETGLLFKKYELEERMESTKEMKEVTGTEGNTQEKQNLISFDEFTKVEIRVGTIVECHEVEGSDKLLKLKVNFGDSGTSQIVSGIKQWYSPQDLISTQAVFAYNLQPRKLFGLESQGMIMMATDEQGKPQIVRPINAVLAGTRLK